MLYSPTLHGIKNGVPSSAVGSLNAVTHSTVVLNASANLPRKIPLFEGRETQWMQFSTSIGSDNATQPAANIGVPKYQIAWPYNWAFKGGFASAYSGNTAVPGLCFAVHRNGFNVFTNSPLVVVLGGLIISGTALLGRSNYVAAHASHQVWLAGDRIELYLTQGSNNWRGGCIYIEGARAGDLIT
jgi:hypothetical protein